jgi:ABC-type proline/glycine betaine transport system ATPase subunit
VAVMNEGEILQFDTASKLRSDPADSFVENFLADEY